MDKPSEATNEEVKEVANEEASNEEEVKNSDVETSAEDSKAPKEQTEQPAEEEFDPLSYIDSLELDDKKKEKLKGGYLRQADYTKKTQDLAKQRKAFEQWKPVIDKLSANPNLLEALTRLGQPNVNQQQPQEEIPDDPKEFLKLAEEKAVQRMRAELAHEEDLKRAEQVDPRLSEDEHFAKVIVGLISQDQDYVSGRKTATQATKDAIEFFDSFASNLKKEVKQDLTQKARNMTMVTPKTSSTLSTKAKAPDSIFEAYKQARNELGS